MASKKWHLVTPKSAAVSIFQMLKNKSIPVCKWNMQNSQGLSTLILGHDHYLSEQRLQPATVIPKPRQSNVSIQNDIQPLQLWNTHNRLLDLGQVLMALKNYKPHEPVLQRNIQTNKRRRLPTDATSSGMSTNNRCNHWSKDCAILQQLESLYTYSPLLGFYAFTILN